MSEQMAYLAGFFDGEGCIHLTERIAYTQYLTKAGPRKLEYKGFFAMIRVGQNVRQPLELFQTAFGGNIRVAGHMGENRRTCRHYEWECPRSTMVSMLESLLPFLTVKKEEAEVAIRFVRTFHAGKRLTDELKQSRRLMIAQVKAAKAIGRVYLSRGAV